MNAQATRTPRPPAPRASQRARAARTVLRVLCTTLALLAAAAVCAQAGQFDLHVDCTVAPGVNHLFSPSNTDLTSFETTQTCPTSGGQDAGVHAGEVLHSPSVFIASGAHADYTFTTVPGTTITGLSWRRYLGQFGDNTVIPALRDDSGASVAGEGCQFPNTGSTCVVGSADITAPPTSITGLNTTSLTFGLRCVPQAPATACLSSASNEQAWFSVYSADITISESTAPSLGSTSGSLQTGVGWLRGPQTLSLASASDASGIQSSSLAIDAAGLTAPTSGGPGVCDFTIPKPCSDLSGTSWTLDTATLPDGPHAAQITATNPAHVTAATASIPFKTDNTAPGAPLALTSSVGADWQTTANTQLTWTLPDQGQASPITDAVVVVCDLNGENCGPATAAGTLTSTTVAAPGPGAYLLEVWLADAAGNVDRAHAASIPLRYSTAPPPAPIGITSSAATWQSSHRIHVSWSIPPRSENEPPITSGGIQACHADGTGCTAPQPVGTTGGDIDLPSDGIYQLRGWLVDASGREGITNVATTTAYVSSTPPTLKIISRSPHGAAARPNFIVRYQTRPGGAAPVGHVHWRLCRGAQCPRSGDATGSTISGRMPAPGTWTLTLEAVDASGVHGTASATAMRYRPAPHLRGSLRIMGRRTAVRVGAASGFSGTVRLQISIRSASVLTVVRFSARVRDGSATRQLRVPRLADTVAATAVFAGDRFFRPEHIRIAVVRPRHQD